MKRPFVLASVLLAGCAMTKPGMTPESKANDRDECKQRAYEQAQGSGNVMLTSNTLYRICMRARGYN